MTSRRVLVVDDDEDLRDNVCEVLELEGFEPIPAAHGQEALELLERLPMDELPRCVLLDLMMPVMDGPTFMEALARGLPDKLERLSILVWSASNKPGSSLPSIGRPVELLRKPVDLERLLAALERHCGS